ncbi:class I SAM-dependent methyltransferase [Gimesia panareensis]|uniref:class I SAM-dependent methyltransferase n=1 Tax=Gimesia panareensis TaxID=2527978 RepID=UPI0018D6FB39|nr:class I SAM-dependent methyltransferase [Gimesia panareensis]
MISEFVYTHYWSVALDVGCGIGANFSLFDKPGNETHLLIGVEPDPSRAAVARITSNSLKFVEAHIATGNLDQFDGPEFAESVDLITCIQVLGHVTSDTMVRMFDLFGKLLVPGGVCLIAVPFITAYYSVYKRDKAWNAASDHHHLVDLNRSPEDPEFRRFISSQEFDLIATTTEFLPVRGFFLSPEETFSGSLPQAVNCPITLERLIDPRFQLQFCEIYSVHLWDTDHKIPLVGDLMIGMERTS